MNDRPAKSRPPMPLPIPLPVSLAAPLAIPLEISPPITLVRSVPASDLAAGVGR